MTSFIDEKTRARIVRLAQDVSPELANSAYLEAAALEVFACAAWSGLGEPGDRMVRTLTDSLGPFAALQAVATGSSPAELVGFISGDEPESDLLDAMNEALGRWMPRLNQGEAIAHLERAKRIGAKLITDASPLWPAQLDDLGEHRPMALWLRGNIDTLEALSSSVAIVGARASTGYGEHVTMEIASNLVASGYCIVSGAAYGIDGMAHRATLANDGKTIAVLAGGIDRLYPSGHDALLHRIIETGAVITELPCGFAPTKWRFLQRNRLIAALSQATVVVEAGWRSGSLNTAHHALELNRPLGVVPGPVTSASSAGCHRLLRETPAVCVTTAEEIIQLAEPVNAIHGHSGASLARDRASGIHPFATRILDCLNAKKGRTHHELAKSSGLSEAETLAVLGLLELSGAARETPTGWKAQSA